MEKHKYSDTYKVIDGMHWCKTCGKRSADSIHNVEPAKTESLSKGINAALHGCFRTETSLLVDDALARTYTPMYPDAVYWKDRAIKAESERDALKSDLQATTRYLWEAREKISKIS